jgi:Tfp pilus assembly protein PilX
MTLLCGYVRIEANTSSIDNAPSKSDSQPRGTKRNNTAVIVPVVVVVVVVLLVVAVIVTVLFCRRRTENGDPY